MRSKKPRVTGTWGKNWGRASLVALALGVTTLGSITLAGCRVTDEDVHLWGRKLSGPKRLVAVLTHDKYSPELRVEAAMTLVTMKPRGGRAVGLLGGDDFPGLLQVLSEMPAEKRDAIVLGMIPALEAGITAPVAADGTDASFPYKDAAFALLTHEGGLVTQPEARAKLEAALTTWTQTSFEKRFDDTSQLYGMEQVLRLLKTNGVRGLTPLLAADFKKIDSVARLIKELGDPATKADASARLVKVALHVDSEAWVKQKAPAVEAANKASKLTVSEKQFAAQLAAYQEEELMRVFGAMKSVGQKPAVDYLIAFAQNDKNSEKRRGAALAALEGNLDRQNAEHAKAMLDFVTSDSTPDSMRDVASRRVGELSRDQVAERLYSLFGNKRWQVRWTVASLLLKMSEAKHLDEFMQKLGKVREMALSEPLAYGPLLADVKGEKPEVVVKKYADSKYPVAARLAALGYYYRYGSRDDLAAVERYKNDGDKVPECPKEAEACEWQCGIVEGGKQVSKEVKTLGDYVSYCIVPALSSRDPVPAAAPASPSPAPTPPAPGK